MWTMRAFLSACAVGAFSTLLGCAEAHRPAVPKNAAAEPTAQPPSSASAASVAAAPTKTPEAALAEVRAIFTAEKVTRYPGAGDIARVQAAGFDEDLGRAALEHIFADCLAQRTSGHAFCKLENDDEAHKILAVLTAVARPGDDGQGPVFTKTMALLMKLDARGVWFADGALKKILDRRHLASGPRCAPPSEEEVADAATRVGDRHVAAKGGPRALTSEERADLAYALAALEESGPPIGAGREDETTVYPKDDPRLAKVGDLRVRVTDAALDGDAAAYVAATRGLLTTLGYPGPIAVNAYGGMRYGGSPTSFLMRDAALYAEAAGERAFAHDLYVRADPGGGSCGTSTGFHAAMQREGAVRTAESCRSSIAAMLWDSDDSGDGHGAARLAKLGFDVTRIYRGALLTLPAAPRTVPAEPGELSWGERIRAIEGIVDSGRGAAIPRMVAWLDLAPADQRVRAIEALGTMAETHGTDPCMEGLTLWGRGSSGDDRTIRAANLDCATKVPDAAMDTLRVALRKQLEDKDGTVRAAAATALGYVADKASVAKLKRLAAKDSYSNGSSICEGYGTPQQKCTLSFPVREAARDALKAIADAETNRKEQLAWAKEDR